VFSERPRHKICQHLVLKSAPGPRITGRQIHKGVSVRKSRNEIIGHVGAILGGGAERDAEQAWVDIGRKLRVRDPALYEQLVVMFTREITGETDETAPDMTETNF
jgi:hypothetical protein